MSLVKKLSDQREKKLLLFIITDAQRKTPPTHDGRPIADSWPCPANGNQIVKWAIYIPATVALIQIALVPLQQLPESARYSA